MMISLSQRLLHISLVSVALKAQASPPAAASLKAYAQDSGPSSAHSAGSKEHRRRAPS